MIIATGKSIEEILQMLQGKKKVFLVGCGQCATTCKFGGEEELAQMAEELKKAGKEITGTVVLDPACIYLKTKKELRKQLAAREGEALLSLACGDGTQTVARAAPQVVYPANDTLFIGEVERVGHYLEVCRACGVCELGWTAGICPMTRCTKGLLNGPCGGSKDGKCEIDTDMDCGWVLIYDRLKERGELDQLRKIRPPKDNRKPRKLVVNQRTGEGQK